MILRYALIALVSATLVASSLASADAELGAHKNIDGAIRPDPSMVSGQTVLFYSVSKLALAEIGATLAYSLYNAHGKPVIFYDEESLAKLPADFQRWVFEHELEHFRLGHFNVQKTLYQKSIGFEGLQFSYEQAADCAAVKMLKDKHFLTREKIIIIAQTAQTVFHDSPLQRMLQASSLNYSHRFKYADSSKRAENIIACFEND